MMKLKSKKIYFTVLFLILLLAQSCKSRPSATQNTVIVEKKNELKAGGLYITQNKNGSFSVSKILVIDDFVIHLRTYEKKFQEKPAAISSDTLKILIGHAPVDIDGFLLKKPELIKVETVKESELEGYKMYLEAMKNS